MEWETRTKQIVTGQAQICVSVPSSRHHCDIRCVCASVDCMSLFSQPTPFCTTSYDLLTCAQERQRRSQSFPRFFLVLFLRGENDTARGIEWETQTASTLPACQLACQVKLAQDAVIRGNKTTSLSTHCNNCTLVCDRTRSGALTTLQQRQTAFPYLPCCFHRGEMVFQLTYKPRTWHTFYPSLSLFYKRRKQYIWRSHSPSQSASFSSPLSPL